VSRLTPFREALAREGALRDVEVDGRRLCVAELGDGPPLVLLHGLAGSIFEWRHLLRPLSFRRRVIALDLLGAGESEKPAGADYSIGAQARRVERLLDTLGLGRIDVLACSFGGGVALRLAQDRPERIGRMALLAPLCYADRVPWYVAPCLLPGLETAAELVKLGWLVAKVARKASPVAAALNDGELESVFAELNAPGGRASLIRWVKGALASDAEEFQAGLRRIASPVLLIWGRGDPTIPVEHGRRLLTDLPFASLVELAAGHVPHLERPADVLSLVEGFLGPVPVDLPAAS
jgi:pimeloyl-ACP methyl ester carboxylesterase